MQSAQIQIVGDLSIGDSVLQPGVYELRVIEDEKKTHQSKLEVVGHPKILKLSLVWWHYQMNQNPAIVILLEGKECFQPVLDQLNRDKAIMSGSTYRDNPLRGIAARHS